MILDVASGNVTEGTPKAYDASMEASAIDAGTKRSQRYWCHNPT